MQRGPDIPRTAWAIALGLVLALGVGSWRHDQARAETEAWSQDWVERAPEDPFWAVEPAASRPPLTRTPLLVAAGFPGAAAPMLRGEDEGAVTLRAERAQRAATTDPDPAVTAVLAVRLGGMPEPGWAEEPGIAGFVVLELGRRGRVEDLALVLGVAEQGPSPSDRLAALWSARRLAPVEDWPSSQEKGRALAW